MTLPKRLTVVSLALLLGRCHAGRRSELRALVSDSEQLTEFVKVVCSVAEQKERNLGPVRDALCPDIERELPQVELGPNCGAAVEAVWDEVRSMCLPSEMSGKIGNREEEIRTLCMHHETVKVTQAVNIVCTDLNHNATISFKPGCSDVLMDVWRLMESKCPAQPLSTGEKSSLTSVAAAQSAEAEHQATDEEVKLICREVSWQQVRVRDIEGVCQAIQKKVNEGLQVTFEPNCQTYLDTIWDSALEECPHGKETILLSVQSIENVICKTATGQEMQNPDQNQAIEQLCTNIMDERPYFRFYPDNTFENCKTAMQGAWSISKSKCPEGRATTPSSQDYEKLICSFATKRQIEGKDYDGTCAKIEESIQWINFDPDCVTAVERVWRMAAEKCPLGSDKVPTPFEVEMLMCGAARRKEMQDMRTIEICSEISLTTPWILRNFDPDCHSVFDVVWDDAVLKCPAGKDTIVNDRELIYWACGHTLAEWIQHRSYDRICSQLLFEVPWLANTVSPAQCPRKIHELFPDMQRICPLGRATPLSRDRLIYTVCSFATAEQVAKHDTLHVCELMVARVPWLQFHNSCHAAVDQNWAEIEEICPSGAYGPSKSKRIPAEEGDMLRLLPEGAEDHMRPY